VVLELPDVVVRVADEGDVGAIASLRSLWSAGAVGDADPALSFYRRAGFIVPIETAGDDRLLVRPGPPR